MFTLDFAVRNHGTHKKQVPAPVCSSKAGPAWWDTLYWEAPWNQQLVSEVNWQCVSVHVPMEQTWSGRATILCQRVQGKPQHQHRLLVCQSPRVEESRLLAAGKQAEGILLRDRNWDYLHSTPEAILAKQHKQASSIGLWQDEDTPPSHPTASREKELVGSCTRSRRSQLYTDLMATQGFLSPKVPQQIGEHHRDKHSKAKWSIISWRLVPVPSLRGQDRGHTNTNPTGNVMGLHDTVHTIGALWLSFLF